MVGLIWTNSWISYSQVGVSIGDPWFLVVHGVDRPTNISEGHHLIQRCKRSHEVGFSKLRAPFLPNLFSKKLNIPVFFIFFPTSQVKQALWLVSVSITCTTWNETEKTHTHTTEVQPQQTQEQNHSSKSSEDIRLKSSRFTSHHSTRPLGTRHPRAPAPTHRSRRGCRSRRRGQRGWSRRARSPGRRPFFSVFSRPEKLGENSPWLNKRGWKELQ